MIECKLRQVSPGQYVCLECGRELWSAFREDQIHLRCQRGNSEQTLRTGRRGPDMTAEAERLAELTGDQSIVSRIARYAKALARWTKAGCPTRTDEEVAAIVALCESATYRNKAGEIVPCYSAASQQCRLCGCRVSASGMAIRNKAYMTTEHCPRKLW